jgi:hypothetical protein
MQEVPPWLSIKSRPLQGLGTELRNPTQANVTRDIA